MRSHSSGEAVFFRTATQKLLWSTVVVAGQPKIDRQAVEQRILAEIGHRCPLQLSQTYDGNLTWHIAPMRTHKGHPLDTTNRVDRNRSYLYVNHVQFSILTPLIQKSWEPIGPLHWSCGQHSIQLMASFEVLNALHGFKNMQIFHIKRNIIIK